MAKQWGSPIVPIRIPAELLAQIDQAIRESYHTREQEPHTRTSFILEAVRETFAHRARAKKARMTRQAKRRSERLQAREVKLSGQHEEERE